MTAVMTPAHVTTTRGCGCGCGGACACSDPIGLERTRFFPRMLVGPDELTQDQLWLKDKLRRHNRLLHGWGVVCGCDVTQAHDAQGRPVPWNVCVDQGYVLGPCGDEIVVDCPVTFDIRTSTTADFGPCTPPPDPWCVDVHVDRRPDQAYYVAIRYDEQLTRPIRTLSGCGCGCDDAECEYSRIRESFALTALDALPDSYRTLMFRGGPGERVGAAYGLDVGLQSALMCGPALRREVRPCPPCPTDPWVVLADVTADSDGLLQIDPIAHRRYVVSFGAYSFTCGAPDDRGTIITLENPQLKARIVERLSERAATALDAEHGGDLASVGAMEATALKGINKRSALGKFLTDRSIADVAAVDRAAFVERASAAGVDGTRAGEVWDSAAHVTSLIREA